jgi:NAD kinase
VILDLSRPRIVLVTRRTRLQVLLERHGTAGQARFYLASRAAAQAATSHGEPAPVLQASAARATPQTAELEASHALFIDALTEVQRAIPAEQRQVRVDRDALDRFIFEPDDIVLVVGQDGLVPNTAKYLQGQLTVGINPDPLHYEGVLCPHRPESTARVLEWAEHTTLALRELRQTGSGEPLDRAVLSGPYGVEQRTMAQAQREDGQRLLALNEVFVGHQSHQSARYVLQADGRHERQSSSGLLCCTGTGSTGWARSLATQLGTLDELPRPTEQRLVWFVREPWPSVATGARLQRGSLGPAAALTLRSELGEGGVVFADGIEADRLEFLEGETVTLSIAPNRLNLVMPGLSGR